MAVAVGGPGGAWVGVGSSRQATGVTPGCVLGVLAASSVTRAAFGAHADAIDAHNAMTAQSVLRMQSPKSTLSPESREKQVIDDCWCVLTTDAGDCCCDPPQGRYTGPLSSLTVGSFVLTRRDAIAGVGRFAA
jgi:hypothetical protein